MTRSIVTTYEEEIPTTLDAFKNWEFSSGSSTGDDFKIFVRLFRNYIKKQLPMGATLVNFSPNHYDLGGFIKKNNKFVYFSISDVRYFPDAWCEDILIRTATSEKDYTGGSNNYTTLQGFKNNVNDLLNSN